MTEGKGRQAQGSRAVQGGKYGVLLALMHPDKIPAPTNMDDSALHPYIKFCQDTYRE